MISHYGLRDRTFSEAFWQVDPTSVGQVVAAAGLAHDIGCPPLGHAGENVVSDFFSGTELGKKSISIVNRDVGKELRLHEGNAQGFRMLNRSMGWRGEGGLNLTCATLAAFGKYPYPLLPGTKKYGIHRADMPFMERVASETGMVRDGPGWRRHPLAYLSEAGDDIAYLCVDIEDAAWMELIGLDEYYDLCRPIVGDAEIDRALRLDTPTLSTQYIRSRMIRNIIAGCVEAYNPAADAIDEGTLGPTEYGHGLVAYTRHAEAFSVIRAFSHGSIYNAPSVKASRKRFRSAFGRALGHLVSDLLEHLEHGPQPTRAETEARFPALSRLPNASLGLSVPEDPSDAFPWLVDQVTLMSDAQALDISRL